MIRLYRLRLYHYMILKSAQYSYQLLCPTCLLLNHSKERHYCIESSLHPKMSLSVYNVLYLSQIFTKYGTIIEGLQLYLQLRNVNLPTQLFNVFILKSPSYTPKLHRLPLFHYLYREMKQSLFFISDIKSLTIYNCLT